MKPTEQFHRPNRSIIGDSMLHQFKELQQKQIQKWNQRRKHKMEMPSTFPKKAPKGIQTQLDELLKTVWYNTLMMEAMKSYIDYLCGETLVG